MITQEDWLNIDSNEWMNKRKKNIKQLEDSISEPRQSDDLMEYDGDEDDDEDDDDTLNAPHRLNASHSVSPSRFDAGDIFQELSEMSQCADRIDSILEQTASEHSTRSSSHRMRSVSPFIMDNEEEANEEEVDWVSAPAPREIEIIYLASQAKCVIKNDEMME